MIKIKIAIIFTMSLFGGKLVHHEDDITVNDKKVQLFQVSDSIDYSKLYENPTPDSIDYSNTNENPILSEENFIKKMKEQMAKFKALNKISLYDLLTTRIKDSGWTFVSDDYNVILFEGNDLDKQYIIYFDIKEEFIDMYVDGEQKTREEFDEWINKLVYRDYEINDNDMQKLDKQMKEQMKKFKTENEESVYNILNYTFENETWSFESDDNNMMLFLGEQNDKKYIIFFNYKKETIYMTVDGMVKSREEFDEWVNKLDDNLKTQMAKFKAPNNESIYDLLNGSFENLEWSFGNNGCNVMFFEGDQQYVIYFFYNDNSIDMYINREKKMEEEFDRWVNKLIQ
ncbi:hypothetical protein [Cytobacillus sp. IB215316]|uniref:hypothetical protein n=1 Tax=Cytobacillus sp. IB215316 TaxID=3097354 RepID=UPI002A13DCC0|nr:hypothetical protein [Cytobacillus sp. IB215316]MDX8362138.1 hypothetical protein [Cytobacillus sp. IB215316]